MYVHVWQVTYTHTQLKVGKHFSNEISQTIVVIVTLTAALLQELTCEELGLACSGPKMCRNWLMLLTQRLLRYVKNFAYGLFQNAFTLY